MELTMSSHISIQTTSTDCQFASAFSQYTFNSPRIQYIATPSSGANLELLLPIGSSQIDQMEQTDAHTRPCDQYGQLD